MFVSLQTLYFVYVNERVLKLKLWRVCVITYMNEGLLMADGPIKHYDIALCFFLHQVSFDMTYIQR